MKKKYLLQTSKLLIFFIFIFSGSNYFSQVVQNFSYTGSMQTFTVPSCVTTISVDLSGAQGVIAPTYGSAGGLGGRVTAAFAVTPGQVLNIFVGGQNYNGGGTGSTYGGVGGGASDIRIGGIALSNRVFVAGGGGGGGTNCFDATNPGGAGGGTLALNGQQCSSTASYGGTGGSQTAGGISQGSLGSSGALGLGGNGSSTYGGGGGGGYYGGGGGSYGGGGGGSSYAIPTASFVVHTQGYKTGNGIVSLSYSFNGGVVSATSTSTLICSGAAVVLSATGPVTNYTWSTGSNNSSITISPTSNTVINVSSTNSVSCVSNASISIVVNGGLPVLSVTSSTNSTCLGKTVTLTATGANTYSWTGGATNGLAFTPSVTSTYTVTGQNACGTTTAVTTVSVAPIVVTLIANPTVVCAGSTSTLVSAAAANSYTWFPVSTNSPSLIVSPQVNTVYTVVASDGTCSGTSTVAVNAIAIPTIAVSPTLITVCSGAPVSLTASGGISYTWTPGNLNGAAITVTPNSPTSYQVVGSNSLGCTTAANAVVITNPSPTVNPIATSNLICTGDAVTISATGASTYLWNTGSTTSSISVSPLSTTVYSVTGTTNSCSSTQTVIITVFIPTLSVIGNTSICSGETATLSASGANSYAWNNGFTTSNIQVSPSSTTLYTLSALTTSSGINCPSSGSIQVIVKPNPTVTAVASRSVMCKGESNILTVSGASNYNWSTGATTSSISITPSLVTTMNYSVVGTSSLGCNGTATLQLKVNSCVGINSLVFNSNEIKVYPNPSNGDLKLSSVGAIELIVTNEMGQLIKTISLNESNNFEMTITSLASGIYFVVGSNQDSKIYQKVIVTK